MTFHIQQSIYLHTRPHTHARTHPHTHMWEDKSNSNEHTRKFTCNAFDQS